MITVALVDTDARLLHELKTYLECEGSLRVDVFSSAVAALDALKSRSYDVIVSEYFLPVTSGMTFLEILRRGRGDRDTPFIFFAQPLREHMIIEALNTGASYVILKRENPKRFFPAVRHFILDGARQKHVKSALKKSEERYRNVVEDLTEFILRFHPDETVQFVNEAYLRYFGISRNDILGKPVCETHLYRDSDLGRQIKGLAPGHPGFMIDTESQNQQGEKLFQRWNIRALFDNYGDIREFQAVGRDITEQKVAEEALRQANQTLTLMNTITRHDVLNQLTVLSGYLEIALQKNQDPGIEGFLTKAQSAAGTIRLQICFTKEFQDVGAEAPQWQNLAGTIRKSTEKIILEGIRVTIDVDEGFWVDADPLVEKVFYNLFDNSVRHGERVTEISLFAEEREECLVIVYQDNGIGVPETAKESIFRREYFKNTGLGLYLIRQILAITGIEIRETGREGDGVRFEMVVPRERFAKRVETGS
ncbi:MAG: PAS domain S-box protein [Methanoregulaceae archaeon]